MLFVRLIGLFDESFQTTCISSQQLCAEEMEFNISLIIPHMIHFVLLATQPFFKQRDMFALPLSVCRLSWSTFAFSHPFHMWPQAQEPCVDFELRTCLQLQERGLQGERGKNESREKIMDTNPVLSPWLSGEAGAHNVQSEDVSSNTGRC